MSIWYHLHGALTHFPIALGIISFFFDLAGAVTRRQSLRLAGFWTLLVAATASVAAGLTGCLVTNLETASGWNKMPSFVLHRGLGIFVAVLLVTLALWRGAQRDKLSGRGFVGYLVGVAFAAAAVGLAGFLGNRVSTGQ